MVTPHANVQHVENKIRFSARFSLASAPHLNENTARVSASTVLISTLPSVGVGMLSLLYLLGITKATCGQPGKPGVSAATVSFCSTRRRSSFPLAAWAVWPRLGKVAVLLLLLPPQLLPTPMMPPPAAELPPLLPALLLLLLLLDYRCH